MRNIKTLFLISTLAALLAACALPPAPPPRTTGDAAPATGQSASTLAGTQWVLSTLNGNPPVAGTEITLDFGTDGSVSGTDGCNRFMGSFTENGTSLSFGPLASTMMACPDDISNQAKTFQDALAVTQSFSTADNTLSLIHTGNAAIATFTPAQTEAAAGTLAGTQWVLGTIGGNTPLAGTQITLNFGEDGRVSGTDGCNRFTGAYTESGESLTFGPLASTMMACPEDITAQATIFGVAMQNTESFTMTDSELALIGRGATLATFTKLSTELTGSKWTVTNFNNGKEAVVGVIEGTTLTVEFADDGSLAGSAGCNNYFGSFTQGDGTISIGPLGSTMKMCTDPAGVMEQETQFLKALESAATYQLDGDKLDLRTKEDALAVVLRRSQ
jgi:heat shock protein HslJ